MKNFALALLLLAPCAASADVIQPEPRDEAWVQRHQAFLQEGPAPLLFLGDSITDSWRWDGKAVWDRDIAPLGARNFGIGGDRVENLWWRVQAGEVESASPRVIVLLIGTNNLPVNSVEEIAQGHQALLSEIRVRAPQAKILVLKVFPRVDAWSGEFRDKIAPLNAALEAEATDPAVTLMDIGEFFEDTEGGVSPQIMFDGLHLTGQGYELWSGAILPTVKQLLGQ
ncbi:MAG TPA: GDSL-type esterase/lipase family protein [Bdellovibrionota bacterium]|nr:GDSL-type esterase/lipase family protein [Bdellovibrionota bacterium]